jgi:hypothetical protein
VTKGLEGETIGAVNTSNVIQNLLAQIAQIQTMERGKLSSLRETSAGTAFKLQVWENGKNISRYIPPDQVPAVQEAVGGYQRFQALTEQYAQLKIEETRAAIAAGSKKKLRARHSSSPKNKKSNS